MVWILVHIFGKLIEDLLEVALDVASPFFEGSDDRSMYTPGDCSIIGYGSKTDFAGYNGGPEIPLGLIVLGRNRPVRHPMI